jgi:tetratricopeptide (TPR) repeat protein
VKLRRLNGILILAIASMAAGTYLWMGRKDSIADTLKSAHGSSALPARAGNPMPGNEHEQGMLRMALEKSPNHAPVLLRLAELESEGGHLKEAAGHLNKILEKDPDNPDAGLELGKILFQLGDVHGAMEHTQRILKAHPGNEDALYNMGAIHANIGDDKGAKTYWNRLAALNSNSESAQKAQQMMARLVHSNP